MTTERYERPRGHQLASMAAAAGVSAAMVAGLVLSSPAVRQAMIKPLTGVNVFLDPPPEPDPTPQSKPVVRHKIVATPEPKPLDTSDPVLPVDGDEFVPPSGGAIGGTGAAAGTILPLPTPSPAPVLTGPSIDPRFARDFQPLYPAGEQRAGREGVVTIRVLVGPDGRVRRAERIAAPSDAFWSATERQALGRWRFRPATRDGVLVEGWRTMTVRFRMTE